MNFLKDFIHIFMPERCLHCSKIITYNEQYLCVDCNLELEYFLFDDFKNNAIQKLFWGSIEIKSAAFLFYYQKETPAQTLLKELKYKGLQSFGKSAAKAISIPLRNKDFFKSIDLILPVPLHPKKEKTRGYNQIEVFGTTLAKSFKVPFLKDGLKRIVNNKSQTTKDKELRHKTVQNSFILNSEYNLQNKHILLIDDVITTGATLSACCKAIQKKYAVSISIITIACVAKLS